MMPLPPEPMTIEQLKAHMDRRFDRLERTKADQRAAPPRGARPVLRHEVRPEARSRQKEDLKRFALKDDLKQFATKDDLTRAFTRLEDRIIADAENPEGIARHHGLVLDDHEVRIGELERGRSLAEVEPDKELQLYCLFLSARNFPPLAEVAERQTR